MATGTRTAHFPETITVVRYSDSTVTSTQTTPAYDTTEEYTTVPDDPAPLVEAVLAAMQDRLGHAVMALPGQRVVGSVGEVLWVREDGALFRNGVRLGINFCSKALSYGGDTFMRGKTDNLWWQWTEAGTWVKLTTVKELDPSIFTN